MNTAAERALRLRFGPNAEPIMALRAAGRVVAPFGDGFRVNDAVVDADKLHALADRLKARKTRLAEAKVSKPTAGDAGTAETSGHGSTPVEPRSPARKAPDSVAPTRKDGGDGERGIGRTCAKCGGPRSKWSKTLCRGCYVPAGRARDPGPPMADARDKFAKIKPYTAGPEQAAAALTPPLDDAPQAARIEEPTATPAPAVGAVAGTSCRCGRPTKHRGRCWVRWGYDGPQERAVGKPRTKVCESCGGPRSYWSNGKCRKCYTRVPQQTQDQRIAALEAELAALKDHVRDAFAEVCEFVGMTGKGR